MAYTEHTPYKPEKVAATAVEALKEQLIVPNLFQREGIDQFRGAANDTVNIKVRGVLPWREYGWRNDRSTAIQFDTYSERTFAVSFGGDKYSAVALTDEQYEMDFNGWSLLMATQAQAVAFGLEHAAIEYLEDDANYDVHVAVADSKLRQGITRIRSIQNKLRVPAQGRRLIVGTNWEEALLNDGGLILAQNVGDSRAASSLSDATIGRTMGYDVVVSQEIDPDTAVALVPSAFVLATAAPTVSPSVPFGASASSDGFALRWIRQYDATHLVDQSVVNCYYGFRATPDEMVYSATVNGNTGEPKVTEEEHYIRALKVTLNGTAGSFSGVTARDTELTAATGLTTADLLVAADGTGV